MGKKVGELEGKPVHDWAKAIMIDKDALDEEIVRQAQYFRDAGEEYAYAVSRRDRLKDELECLRASLGMGIRLAASKADPPTKLTEGSIGEQVITDERFQKLQSSLRSAELEVDLASANKAAFHAKGMALHDLAELYQTNYYQTSMVGGAERSRLNEAGERGRRLMDKRRREKAEGRDK